MTTTPAPVALPPELTGTALPLIKAGRRNEAPHGFNMTGVLPVCSAVQLRRDREGGRCRALGDSIAGYFLPRHAPRSLQRLQTGDHDRARRYWTGLTDIRSICDRFGGRPATALVQMHNENTASSVSMRGRAEI